MIVFPIVLESYITHVRITEDATHPSSPFPPNGPPENKKPRVIIISVRKSGRVRVHKARENAEGTFSIGKTWMLEDLSAIQSYASFVPRTQGEQQQKEWASNCGFTVTIGKPYYWHARTSKEKEYFIGSLVKIYRKYTNGNMPNLIGFDDSERQMLARHGQPQNRPPGPPGPPGGPPLRAAGPIPPGQDSAMPPSLQPSYRGRETSRDGPQEIRRKPSEDPAARARSREQISRPSTGSRPSTEHGKPAPSPFDLHISPPSLSAGPPEQPPPRAPERNAAHVKASTTLPESRGNEPPPAISTTLESSYGGVPDGLRPGSSRSQDRGPKPPTLAPQPGLNKGSEYMRSTDGLRPTTAGSSNSDTRDTAPRPVPSYGPKSPQRESGEKASAFNQPPLPQDRSAPDSLSAGGPTQPREPSSSPGIEGLAAEPAAMFAANMPAEEPVESPNVTPSVESAPPADSPSQASSVQAEKTDEFEPHRPGLGPMVKKKAGKDIAGAWKKAATAAGAFKPRAGGAGERLLAAAKKTQVDANGPDGITGVVPAPSLTRSATDPPQSPVATKSDQDLQPPTAAAAAAPSPAAITIPPSGSETPTVEITEPALENKAVAPVKTPEISQEKLTDVVVKVEDRSRTPSPAAQGRRRRHREDHTMKYCQALGIDPRILDGRGIDFDDILSDLGWNGRLADEQKIEDLEADVRREIGRVEATSWLGNLEQQEGKVEQLASLIDRTIEECDELDGLLTLYSHELNVSLNGMPFISNLLTRWN